MINDLIKYQHASGSFENSVFSTSLILLSINDPKIKDKALKWLLNQKNENWIFDGNLGINFCALAAVLKHDPSIIDGTALAKILETLISSESTEGGPYYSNAKDKNYIDLGTNTAIAYFLSLQDVDLPNMEDYIRRCINETNFNSKTFNNKYFVVYLISKFIKTKKDQLINYLIKERSQEAVLNRLLILNSLIDLGYDKKHLVGDIKSIKKQELVISSPSLALYLELINKMDKKEYSGASFFNEREQLAIDQILELAKQRFSNLSPEMQEIALNKIKKTIKGNKDKQMPLIAFYTKEALGEKGRQISDKTVFEMGLANIFFWTAFIIYDDFWDEDEERDPKVLPTANLYARHYVNYFSSLFEKNLSFNHFFHNLMDNLDNANTWETMHCRTKVTGSKFIIPENIPEYKDYELKFYPSSGHILGPVAIFYSLGFNEKSPEVTNLIGYFKNYLIAMQINDDLHDFEEDLKRGHLSTAIALFLKNFKEKYPDKKEIDLNADFEEVQKIFWFKTMNEACKRALYHTGKSREALKKISILEDLSPLEHYINTTENIAKKALEEYKKSVDFLESLPFL